MLGRIRRRQELRAAQEKARTSKVTLARQYRVGDLPDVKSITTESFLGPLGELSETLLGCQKIIIAARWNTPWSQLRQY